jgi:lysozyme
MTADALIIDLYYGDKHADFAAMKAGGAAGVCVKASDGYYMGGSRLDPLFQDNWKRAKDEGLPRCAYHFWRSDVSQATQVADFCSQLAADSGEMRPLADIERDDANMGPQRLADATRTFVLAVEGSLHLKPMIYTSPGFWGPIAPYASWASGYELWVAHYGVVYPRLPAPWSKWTFWQYSDNTGFPGMVPLGVDKSWFCGDAAAFGVYLRGLHAAPAPEPTDAEKLGKLWSWYKETHP